MTIHNTACVHVDDERGILNTREVQRGDDDYTTYMVIDNETLHGPAVQNAATVRARERHIIYDYLSVPITLV